MLFVVPISLGMAFAIIIFHCALETLGDGVVRRQWKRERREQARLNDPVYQAQLRLREKKNRQHEQERLQRELIHTNYRTVADAWYARNWWWLRLPKAVFMVIIYGCLAAMALPIIIAPFIILSELVAPGSLRACVG